jgi:hypothetical protein
VNKNGHAGHDNEYIRRSIEHKIPAASITIDGGNTGGDVASDLADGRNDGQWRINEPWINRRYACRPDTSKNKNAAIEN